MVLLDMTIKLLEKNHIGIVHVHHNKREQSNVEETFIRNFAKEQNINVYIKKLPKYDGKCFQAWARSKRYEFFYEIAKKYNYQYVLLAHHADDNLETILMRFLKSSSLKGYAGIDEISKYKDLILYRPLLTFSKEEIRNYALTNHLVYYEDDSNQEDDYTRNRIRHKIVPLLKMENPNIYEAVNNYSKTLKEASNILEENINDFVNNQVKVYSKFEMVIKEFSSKRFKDLSSFLQEQVIFFLTKEIGLSKKQVNELIRQILLSKEKIVNQVTKEFLLVKEYGYCKLIFGELKNSYFEILIDRAGIYQLPFNQKLIVEKNNCYFEAENQRLCYNIQKLPILIRSKKDGDKLNTSKGKISVSDYLTNHKVCYLNRFYTYVICNEKNEIIKILSLKDQYEEDINGRSKKTKS